MRSTGWRNHAIINGRFCGNCRGTTPRVPSALTTIKTPREEICTRDGNEPAIELDETTESAFRVLIHATTRCHLCMHACIRRVCCCDYANLATLTTMLGHLKNSEECGLPLHPEAYSSAGSANSGGCLKGWLSVAHIEMPRPSCFANFSSSLQLGGTIGPNVVGVYTRPSRAWPNGTTQAIN